MSLQAALLERTRPTPVADSDRLSVEHVAAISRHLAGTLFRHFKLYACVFSTPQGHTKYTVTPLVRARVVILGMLGFGMLQGSERNMFVCGTDGRTLLAKQPLGISHNRHMRFFFLDKRMIVPVNVG